MSWTSSLSVKHRRIQALNGGQNLSASILFWMRIRTGFLSDTRILLSSSLLAIKKCLHVDIIIRSCKLNLLFLFHPRLKHYIVVSSFCSVSYKRAWFQFTYERNKTSTSCLLFLGIIHLKPYVRNSETSSHLMAFHFQRGMIRDALILISHAILRRISCGLQCSPSFQQHVVLSVCGRRRRTLPTNLAYHPFPSLWKEAAVNGLTTQLNWIMWGCTGPYTGEAPVPVLVIQWFRTDIGN